MAGTLVVGRVAVRIWPDTRLFKQDLEAQLEEKTSSVDAKVPVEAELQAEQMEADLEQKVKRLSRIRIALRAQVKGLDKDVLAATKAAEGLSKADPITFSTDVHGLDLTKAMDRGIKEAITRRFASAINSSLAKGMKVDPEQLQKLAREVEVGLGPVSISPSLGKGFLDEARKARSELQGEANKVSWFDPKNFERDVVARLGGKTVTVPIKYNGSDKDFRNQYRKLVNDSIRDTNKTMPGILGNAFGRAIGNPIIESVRAAGFRLKNLFSDVSAIRIKAEVDESTLAKAEIELELWFKRLKVMTTHVKTVLDKKSVRGVITGLGALSGGRVFKNLVTLEPFKHLDEQLPKISLMATMLGQAANYLISMSSDAFALGRSIAQIAPAALVLPGIFAGAATSMIVLTTAMSTMKKQAVGVYNQWSALQKKIGKNFWSAAAKPMSTFLSDMSGGFKRTSTILGGFIAKVLGSFHDIVSPHIASYVTALGKGFSIIGGASPAIAHIVKTFGDLGAKATPRLAQWVADMTNKFSAWMKLKGKSGLNRMIEDAITNIKSLWNVAAGTQKILSGISKAATAAGGATLTSLGDSLQRIAKIVNSSGFQARLTNVFASARDAIENMVGVSGPAVSKMFRDIGDNADKLLPKVGIVAGKIIASFATVFDQPQVGNSILNFFDALNGTLDKLQPTLTNVSNGMAGVINVLAKMLTAFEPIVEIAFGALESHATGLLKSIQVVIENLSSGLATYMTDLLPAIDQLAPALLSLLENTSGDIKNILVVAGPAVEALLRLLAGAATVLSSIPGPLQGVFALALGGALAVKVALGGWKSVLGEWAVKAKAVGASVQESFKGSAISNFGSKLKGLVSNLAGIAIKAFMVSAALNAIGAALDTRQAVAGADALSLAMQKIQDNSDFSSLNTQLRNSMWPDAVNKFDDLTLSMKKFKDQTQGFSGNLTGLTDKILGFLGTADASNTQKLKDTFESYDQFLANLTKTDPSSATAIFDQLKAKAIAAGWSVEDLSKVFDDYQAAAALAAGKASGSFKKSAEEIAADAEAAKSSFLGTQNTMVNQMKLLGSKNKALIAHQLVQQRNTMLTEMAKTATGADKEILGKASALNDKISSATTKLGNATSKKAKEKYSKELDTLLATYQEKFGTDISTLLTGGSSGSDTMSAAISAMVGNGLTPEAKATLTSSIETPVNTAVDNAKIKIATLPGAITGLDIAGKVNAKVAEAQTAITTGAATITAGMSGTLITFAVTASTMASTAVGTLRTLVSASFGAIETGMSEYVIAYSTQSSLVEGMASTLRDRVKGNVTVDLSLQGAAAVNSFISGATSADSLSRVVAAAKLVGKTFKDNKGPLSYDRVMMVPEGKATVAGYVDGILSQVNAVKSAAKTVTNAAAGEFGSAADRAISAAATSSSIDKLAVSANQTVYTIGDVTVDVKELEGVKTIDQLAKTLRRKKRQAGGK